MTALRFGLSRTYSEADSLASRVFAGALGGQLGVTVAVSATTDPRALVDALIGGAVDLAWMSPMGYVAASRRGATLAAVAERLGALSYRAAILVPRESAAASLADLRGARAVWVDPTSASGCVFPRLELERLGLAAGRDFSETFAGGARAALQAVLAGAGDFCATFVREGAAAEPELAAVDLEQLLPDASAGLRVLAISDEIPADGVALSPTLDASRAAALGAALCSLDTAPGGPSALSQLMQADRLRSPPSKLLSLVARLCAEPLARL